MGSCSRSSDIRRQSQQHLPLSRSLNPESATTASSSCIDTFDATAVVLRCFARTAYLIAASVDCDSQPHCVPASVCSGSVSPRLHRHSTSRSGASCQSLYRCMTQIVPVAGGTQLAAADTRDVQHFRQGRRCASLALTLFTLLSFSSVSARQYPMNDQQQQEQIGSDLYNSLSWSHSRRLSQASCPDASEFSVYCMCCLTWNCFRYHLSNKYWLGAYMYILASHIGEDALASALQLLTLSSLAPTANS